MLSIRSCSTSRIAHRIRPQKKALLLMSLHLPSTSPSVVPLVRIASSFPEVIVFLATHAVPDPADETVKLLLANRVINPNGVHPPRSGTTPLHLAASLARDDLVALLLEQPAIDDTVRDANGKTCKEVARSKETIAVIQREFPAADIACR